MGAMQEIDTTKHKAFQGNHATQKKGKKLQTNVRDYTNRNLQKNKNTKFNKGGARNNHCKSKSPITQQTVLQRKRQEITNISENYTNQT
jgi:hypothetical protein